MSDLADETIGEISVSLAALSDAAQAHVIEAIRDADATHSLDHLDVRAVIDDADAQDYHRAAADEFQHLQAKAASEGNWELAHGYAEKAEDALQSLADHGGSDVPVAEAAEDVSHLDSARFEQRTANAHARAASEYAAEGDTAHAQMYADLATQHQAQADQAGHDGVAGATEQHAERGGLSGHDHQSDVDHAPDADEASGVAAQTAPAEATVHAATADAVAGTDTGE